METIEKKPAGIESFTFGDAESVVNMSEFLDYVESWFNGRWFEPPVPASFLSKFFRAHPYHTSAIGLKRNLLQGAFIPHKLLDKANFTKLVLDYLVFGNAYLEDVTNQLGGSLGFKHCLSKYTRRGEHPDDYFYIYSYLNEKKFNRGSVWHMIEPDISQEIYGLPEYLAAVHGGLLGEAATIFRRRYYQNGSHAGFILYINDAAQEQKDIDNIREALKKSKGPGNFRNLFLYSPNGKKDGVQLIPVSEVMAKDDFTNIKEASRDDVLAAHRVPASLIGVIPKNTSGLGDISKAREVFYKNEIIPIQERLLELNEWKGEEIIKFKPFEENTDPVLR